MKKIILICLLGLSTSLQAEMIPELRDQVQEEIDLLVATMEQNHEGYGEGEFLGPLDFQDYQFTTFKLRVRGKLAFGVGWLGLSWSIKPHVQFGFKY